jgi:hypothetical protein
MNSIEPIAALAQFLEAQSWPVLRSDDRSIHGVTGGDNGGWAWLAACVKDGEILIFRATLAMRVPRNRRAATAEFLSRANWGMIFGNFQIDWSDGQVIFHTSAPVAGDALSEDTFKHLVWANCSMMNRYLPGLAAVAFGRSSPKRAIAQVEKPPKKKPNAANDGDRRLTDAPRHRRFLPGDN